MRQFERKRADGWSNPRGKTELLAEAAKRVVAGTGPFDVVRADYYHHRDLNRFRALRVLAAVVGRLERHEQVTVSKGNGEEVFRCRRVKNTDLYKNPLRDVTGLRGLRQDMGVDYSTTADSPVYAIGPGIIRRFDKTSTWPWDASHPDGGGMIVYELTDGPGKGKHVYLAEKITLNGNLKVGDRVTADTRIASLHPGFANCEMGWADARLTAMAVGCYREGARTAAGDNFDKLMQALGSVAGLAEGRAISCALPSGWPKTWADKV